MIATLRARGADPELVSRLEKGAIPHFHTETGEMLEAPLELAMAPHGAVATRSMGTNTKETTMKKKWEDMTPTEREALLNTDPWTYKRLKENAARRWSEMTPEEQLALYKADPGRVSAFTAAFAKEHA